MKSSQLGEILDYWIVKQKEMEKCVQAQRRIFLITDQDGKTQSFLWI